MVCSTLTHGERSHAAKHQRPLPSIAASVPRGRISSTLPAFTIPVRDLRMSSTLPASNGTTKLSMPSTARCGFRRKDGLRRDRSAREPGRSKQRRSDKPNELVLQVVPIDISADNCHNSHEQENLAVDAVERHSTASPLDNEDDDDDSDTATWQFQRTARLRQGVYFKKSSKRSLRETTTDAHSTTNNECSYQVC